MLKAAMTAMLANRELNQPPKTAATMTATAPSAQLHAWTPLPTPWVENGYGNDNKSTI